MSSTRFANNNSSHLFPIIQLTEGYLPPHAAKPWRFWVPFKYVLHSIIFEIGLEVISTMSETHSITLTYTEHDIPTPRSTASSTGG